MDEYIGLFINPYLMMNWYKRKINPWVSVALLSTLVLLSAWREPWPTAVEKGFIKGRTRVTVRVYEETVSQSKGSVLYSDWLDADQYVSLSTERGRIIYDYKYPNSDTWTMDVHADCRGSREEALVIP